MIGSGETETGAAPAHPTQQETFTKKSRPFAHGEDGISLLRRGWGVGRRGAVSAWCLQEPRPADGDRVAAGYRAARFDSRRALFARPLQGPCLVAFARVRCHLDWPRPRRCTPMQTGRHRQCEPG